MNIPAEFDEIRPYAPEELPQVFEELIADPMFQAIVARVMPGIPFDRLAVQLRQCKTNLDFQKAFIYNLLKELVKKCAKGLEFECSAIQDKSKNYTFISNHRDIVLDSAFLSVVLIENGMNTVEIAIGDHLLIYPWIKKIVRIPGERAKVAVESYDDRVDPVGACVGMKGSRIYTVVKELRNENIDVVNYTANTSLMIQRSLNPAKISTITIDEERKTASVYLKPEEVSLAIGKGGLNIRLSKMLTGYDIDVYREIEEEDVALTEFADEIDAWIIEALKNAGFDTAKSVLELPAEDIAQRADLEVEQAEAVVAVLKAEFE